MDQHTRDRWLRRVRSVKRQISALYASEILDSELLQDVHRFPCISQWTIRELDLSTSHRVFGTQNQIEAMARVGEPTFFHQPGDLGGQSLRIQVDLSQRFFAVAAR